MKLSPVLITKELESENLNKAKDFGLMDCIECGCCSYVCPSHIKIVQRIRLGKARMRAKMAEDRAKAEEKAKAEDKSKAANGGTK